MMKAQVRAKAEFENDVIIEEGDNVKIVISGTGAIVEGMAVKISAKAIGVELAENFVATVQFDDINDVEKQ